VLILSALFKVFNNTSDTVSLEFLSPLHNSPIIFSILIYKYGSGIF